MSKADASPLTDCGIPGIGRIPYGVHLCHFYIHRQDLVDSLIPYFQTGLENEERCLWITSVPYRKEEAHAQMARVMPSFAQMVTEGRIRIVESDQWYPDIQSEAVVGRWLKEEERALAEGYRGLRIAGNAGFLKRQDWDAFMRHEQAINKTIEGRRIVGLCSYDLRQTKATDLFEVTRNHQHTLCRNDKLWEVVDRAYGPMGRLASP